ncbi:MAG: PH domain-containing protein [Candidatus Asgardarchaeia archaeon]
MELKPNPKMKKLYVLYLILAISLGIFSWSLPLLIAFGNIPEVFAIIMYLDIIPTVIISLFVLYWIPKYYDSILYIIDDKKVMSVRGVWWKRESYIPIEKVINVIIKQDPVQRFFGLVTLGFHTAAMGIPLPEVRFDHLSIEEAERIKREVFGKLNLQ